MRFHRRLRAVGVVGKRDLNIVDCGLKGTVLFVFGKSGIDPVIIRVAATATYDWRLCQRKESIHLKR